LEDKQIAKILGYLMVERIVHEREGKTLGIYAGSGSGDLLEG
jgi:hypothetical protein